MKILLVKPISKTHYNVPPLGLGYLASALIKQGFDVEILDCVKERLNSKKFGRFIESSKPDAMGLQIFSCDLENAKTCLDLAKQIISPMVTFAGGAHPSGAPEETLRDLALLDYAFQGEGEIGVPLLMNKILRQEAINFSEIPGLIWRNGANIICNPPIFVKDLDALGFPSWDLIDPRTYSEEPQGAFFKNLPVAPIITSRGCPYKCTFCAGRTISGQKIRLRSVEGVTQEVEMLYKTYGVREIHIIDDNFTYYKERVIDFCDKILEHNLKISLSFPNGVRLDTLDKEILESLKRAGLYSFTVGIESGSQRVLRHMKKNLDLGTIEEKIDLINEVDLEVNGFFILGYPIETQEDIKKTVKFAKSLKLKRAHFGNFLPLPGAEITEELKEKGKLKQLDWEQLFYSKVPFSPDGITPHQLKKFQRRAFCAFYLRPRTLIKLVLDIKSWRHFRNLIKRIIDYLFVR